MVGLATVIEAAIRYPGFSFVNVQSPCVTYGEEDQQLRAHKKRMKSIVSMQHDPADFLKALELSTHYGSELYTGVFYRNPSPPPTYNDGVKERQELLSQGAVPRERVLDAYLQKG